MKISDGKKENLNNRIKYEKLKKHINEKDGTERRAKKYVEKHNTENTVKTVNGVKNKITEKHYGTRKSRNWEKDDAKTMKSEKYETCILFDDTENIMLKNMKIVKTVIYETHREETDKIHEKIFGRFANVKLELETMNLDKIPEKVKFENEEVERKEIFRIMLGKNLKLYKIISAEIR